MLKFTSGNMFETPADIRINTVNCKGAMGAGVALAFKKKYPVMFREYKALCSKKELRPGNLHLWENQDVLEPLTIVNFPTKDDWKQPSEYSYIEDGLKALRKELISKPNSRVTLPALGCGHGGLDWSKVKSMIETELGDLNTEIFIFEPSDSQSIGLKISPEEVDQLKSENIFSLTPSNKFYPKTLKGKSSQVFYIKGDEKVLERPSMTWVISRKLEDREEKAIDLCFEALKNQNLITILGTTVSERKLAKKFLNQKKKVVLICDVGLLQFKIPKELIELWDESLITLISPFPPSNSGVRYNGVEVLKTKTMFAKATLVTTLEMNWVSKITKKILMEFPGPFYINYNQDLSTAKQRMQEANFQPISRSTEGKPKLESIIQKCNSDQDSHTEDTMVTEKTVDYKLENEG